MKKLIALLLLIAAHSFGQSAGVTYVTTSFSATPTFTVNAGVTNFTITLTGNVTSSTFSSAAAGVGSFRICQDGTGGRTIVFPTSVGFETPSTVASTCSVQAFTYDGTTLRAVGKMLNGLGLTTKSGATYYQGKTSGGVAFLVGVGAGTAIGYVWPSTNGAANEFLSDTGTTTCPDTDNTAVVFPTTCHLMAFVASTGTGNVVRATSPTLVTPALGTPTALVLANATGLPTAGLVANAVTSAKLALVNTYRICDISIGDTSGSAITNGQLGPQKRVCFIPYAATILEVDVSADAGTPNVIVGKNTAGTQVNITSAALATAASGGIACSNTGGTTGLDGATTCSATLQNTSVSAGAYLELVSGTAGGTAKWMTAHVVYAVN